MTNIKQRAEEAAKKYASIYWDEKIDPQWIASVADDNCGKTDLWIYEEIKRKVSMSELKTCPFCGAEARIEGGCDSWEVSDNDFGSLSNHKSMMYSRYSVAICSNRECAATIRGGDEEEVSKLWNRRLND